MFEDPGIGERGRRGAVGRELGRGRAVGQPAPGPAEGMGGPHPGQLAHGLDAPDAAALHIEVVEHHHRPERRPIVLADHAQLQAAGAGVLAVRVQGHDRVGLDAVVHLAVAEPLGAIPLERPPYADGAEVIADAGDGKRRVRLKQVDHVVPHLAVDVVAIGVLEVPDGVLVLQRLHARGEGTGRGAAGGGRDLLNHGLAEV